MDNSQLEKKIHDLMLWMVFPSFSNPLNELVKIGKPTIPYLLDSLNSERWEVRSNACILLGKIEDASTTPHLIERLQDPDDRVRYEAAGALAKIKDKSAINALLKTLEDRYESVRSNALPLRA